MKLPKHIQPPKLITRRLVLRAFVEDDLGDVLRIIGNFDVSKWLTSVSHPYTKEDAHIFFQKAVQGDFGFIWAIEFEGSFIGLISTDPELGYWSCPSVWRKGLMSEAVKSAVNAYFKYTHATRIISSYFEGNIGSVRVLEKAGFVGTEPRLWYNLARNKEVNLHQMVLTRARWMSFQCPSPEQSEIL